MSENKKTIIRKEKKDGTSEIIVTKSPSKTIFGKIVIIVLAFGMLLGGVGTLVIALLSAIGVF